MAQYKSTHTGAQIDAAVTTVENLATVATSGSYNDLSNKPSIPSNLGTAGQVLAVNSGGTATEWVNPASDAFIVHETSDEPVSGAYDHVPADKTYAETLAAIKAGKHVVLTDYSGKFKGTSTHVNETNSEIYFANVRYFLNNNMSSVSYEWSILDTTGVKNLFWNSDTSSGKHFSILQYTTNTLPRLIGSSGQVPVSNGTSGTLVWQDLPAQSTTTIRRWTTDTE